MKTAKEIEEGIVDYVAQRMDPGELNFRALTLVAIAVAEAIVCERLEAEQEREQREWEERMGDDL